MTFSFDGHMFQKTLGEPPQSDENPRAPNGRTAELLEMVPEKRDMKRKEKHFGIKLLTVELCRTYLQIKV